MSGGTRFRAGPGDVGFLGAQEHADHRGLNLQFRAEVFNILNRANFNTPNVIMDALTGTTPVPNPIAGQITSTSTTSRQVQFALKLLW